MHNNLDEIKGASPKTSVAPATASSALDVIGKTEKKKMKKKKYRKKKGSTSSNRAGSAHVCDRCGKSFTNGHALGGHKKYCSKPQFNKKLKSKGRAEKQAQRKRKRKRQQTLVDTADSSASISIIADGDADADADADGGLCVRTY